MRNLFDVNVAIVEQILAEANAALLRRCEDLLAAHGRMPPTLPDDASVARARSFARQLKAAIAEARRAKIDDKAPFIRANKAVDAFFGAFTKRLSAALLDVERALEDARQRATAPVAGGDVRPVATAAGRPVIVIADQGQLDGAPRPSHASVAAIPTIWKAGEIDRRTLDLDALRSLMTDAELDRLVARWLKQHGPAPLEGVRWTKVVKT